MKYFGSVEMRDGQFVITEMDAHVRIKLKSIFNKIRKSQAPPYIFKVTNENCRDLLWFNSRYPMKVSAGAEMALDSGAVEHKRVQDELVSIFSADYKFSPVRLNEGMQLRDYQNRFVAMFDKTKRMMLADDVGVGKTPQIIGSILSGDKRPSLVVVQTHLVDQWLNEIKKFSDLKAVKINGRKVFRLPEADVYVTKYGLLQYWSDVLSEFGFKSVYFDEVQELRKSDSNKYEAAKNITKDVEFVCGATATPIYNYADEIWNIFNIIRPGFLGEYWDFAREWCNDGQWVKDPKALGDYLRSENIFLRRTATDVGRELPQLNKIVHTVEYDEKAVVEFESLAKSLAVKATTGAFTERGQAYRELDIMMRQITGVSKARYVAEYIKILLKNNEPVLVGVWHREVIRILMEELAEFYPVLYTGTESEKQKNESKRAFIAGETNCMLLSLRSGVGLDGLQHRARYVVFAELDWSPSIHAQFIGRLNRDGQEHQVTVIYLVSEYGSDPLMISLNGAKYSHATQITDPLSGGAAEQVSDDSRLKMLAERVLKGG